MPSHSDDQHSSPTIVPDRDDTATRAGSRPGRHRQSVVTPSPARGPRVGMLWFLILLLIVAVGLGGWQYWQDRQAWESRIARLDTRLEATGTTVDASGESLRAEFDRLRDQLEATRAVVGSLETRVADARQTDDVDQQVEALREADQNQRNLARSLQSSFSALESTASDERGVLGAKLSTLEGQQQRGSDQLASLSNRLDTQLQEQRESLQASMDELDHNQQDLVQRLDALESNELESETVDALESRVSQLQSEMSELRRGQIALNAGVESIRSQLDILSGGGG